MFFFAVFAYLFLHGLSERFFKHHGCKYNGPWYCNTWNLDQDNSFPWYTEYCTKCKVIVTAWKRLKNKIKGHCFGGRCLCVFSILAYLSTWSLDLLLLLRKQFFTYSHDELTFSLLFKKISVEWQDNFFTLEYCLNVN